LVKRVKDEKDRRIVRIVVLEKGHQLINEVLHVRKNYLADLLKELNQEEKDFILKGIGMIYSKTL